MSRVGKIPVKVLQGVKVEIRDGKVKVEGPKGKLQYLIPEGVSVTLDNGSISVKPDDKNLKPNSQALYGVSRTIVHNMVHGVHTGFTKDLEIVGVGYRAATKGNVLTLNVGFSHQIDYELPAGITAKVDANTKLSVTGADKVLVGMVASKIRSFRPPEPYQGKGIKYANEHIIRKQGKAAAGAGAK